MKNVEIKARITSEHCEKIKAFLDAQPDLEYKGLDHSEDVYFNVPEGRLKLRRGNIENCLVAYQRINTSIAKESSYDLAWLKGDGDTLLNVLESSLGVKVIVRKKRHIYMRGTDKFLLDKVEGLEGHFVEIEIRDEQGNRNGETMRQDCEQWQELLEITPDMLQTHSYSDLLERVI